MRIINRYQNGGLVSLQEGGQAEAERQHWDALAEAAMFEAPPQVEWFSPAESRRQEERRESLTRARPLRSPIRTRDDDDSGGLYGWVRRTLGPDVGRAAARGAKDYVMDISPASLGLSSLGGMFGPVGYVVGNVVGRGISDEDSDFIPGRPLRTIVPTFGLEGPTQSWSPTYGPFSWLKEQFEPPIIEDDSAQIEGDRNEPLFDVTENISPLPPAMTVPDPRLHGDLMRNLPRTPGSYVRRKPTPPLPLPMTDVRLSQQLPLPMTDVRLSDGTEVKAPWQIGDDYGVGGQYEVLSPFEEIQGEMVQERLQQPPSRPSELVIDQGDIVSGVLPPERDYDAQLRAIRNQQEDLLWDYNKALEDPFRLPHPNFPGNLTEVIDPFAPVVEEEDFFDVAMQRRFPGQRRWTKEQPYPEPYGPEGEAPTIYAAQGGMIPNIALQAGGNPIVADVTRDIEEGINSGIRSLVANAYAQGNVPPPPSSPQPSQAQLLNQGLTMLPNTANMPVPQQPQQPPAQSNISNMYAQSTQPQSYYMQPNQIR